MSRVLTIARISFSSNRRFLVSCGRGSPALSRVGVPPRRDTKLRLGPRASPQRISSLSIKKATKLATPPMASQRRISWLFISSRSYTNPLAKTAATKMPKVLKANESGISIKSLILETPIITRPSSSGNGEAMTKTPASIRSHRGVFK